MTYATREGRQFVVVATGAGSNAELVAFSIGGREREAGSGKREAGAQPAVSARLTERRWLLSWN
jgi:hypothetical protein